MYKGIDVSDYQGSIDWKRVKSAGVQFAVLRSVRGSGKTDYQFADNVNGCRANGIPLDVYRYSYADTAAKAVREAEQVVKLLGEKKVDCTVWWDMEDNSLKGLGKKALTSFINQAEAVITSAGYPFGIYCNKDWYQNVLDVKEWDCPFWVARYPSEERITIVQNPDLKFKPQIVQELFGWQYSSKGSVPGIAGSVDLNVIYADIEGKDSATAGEKPTASDPYPQPTYLLYRGRLKQSAEYVKWLQHKLAVTEDGIFGRNTDRALREYQRAHGLAADGKCGPKTVAAMNQK